MSLNESGMQSDMTFTKLNFHFYKNNSHLGGEKVGETHRLTVKEGSNVILSDRG
ncbi:MAG: hypothetical protein RMY16_11605 [Nostoc sp. DedQUE12b]|uniref:hypothetical protein n=1 Tax=unclassified Nostoc TaxID=2593658 RepID=UPI002AD3E0AD|nr:MULTISPECIES: hypothetical protein [unclassified Nostoc]MDZ7954709.1 hypothetical protein [Nostoc sp. DedQUE09]MDZ8086189.1 hypothetical protein [Nostoc sp. DedQUE12b]